MNTTNENVVYTNLTHLKSKKEHFYNKINKYRLVRLGILISLIVLWIILLLVKGVYSFKIHDLKKQLNELMINYNQINLEELTNIEEDIKQIQVTIGEYNQDIEKMRNATKINEVLIIQKRKEIALMNDEYESIKEKENEKELLKSQTALYREEIERCK